MLFVLLSKPLFVLTQNDDKSEEKNGLQSHKSATFSYREWRRRAQERGADIDYDFFVKVSLEWDLSK